MSRRGQDYGLIALGGFEHTLRTKEAKERFENEKKDVSLMSIADQIKHWENVAKAEAIEAMKPKPVVVEKPRFGNLDVFTARTNRENMAKEALAKGKKVR